MDVDDLRSRLFVGALAFGFAVNAVDAIGDRAGLPLDFMLHLGWSGLVWVGCGRAAKRIARRQASRTVVITVPLESHEV